MANNNGSTGGGSGSKIRTSTKAKKRKPTYKAPKYDDVPF